MSFVGELKGGRGRGIGSCRWESERLNDRTAVSSLVELADNSERGEHCEDVGFGGNETLQVCLLRARRGECGVDDRAWWGKAI